MDTQLKNRLNSVALIGMVFYTADGSIQACNSDAEKILGYTATQLVGTTSFEPPWQTIYEDGSSFPPDFYPASVTLKTLQPCTDILMGFYKPNGQLVWLLINSQPLFEATNDRLYGVVVTFRELSHSEQFQSSQHPAELISSSATQEQTKVLLIEDSQIDREVYRRYLQASQSKYCFYEAESGEEALEMYRQCQPDLILLDYHLPDMDGLEWLSLWQQQTEEDRPPVIVLTGQGDETIAVQFLKQGAADYLIKNQITVDKFNWFIERAIEEAQLRSQHKQTQLQLQQNQQLLEQITEAMPGIVYLVDTLQQKNLYVNSQILPLLGYSPEQELLEGGGFVVQVMHPEDFERLSLHLQQLEQSPLGQVCEFEYRMRHNNGEWRWFSSQDRVLSRTIDGKLHQVLGIAQDITARKQIELDLRNSEERLRLATEASEMGMWFWDLVNNKIDFTTRAKTLFNFLF